MMTYPNNYLMIKKLFLGMAIVSFLASISLSCLASIDDNSPVLNATHSAAALSTPSDLVTVNKTIDNSANIAEVLLALLAIVAFIFFVAWCMKRMGYSGMPKNQAMKVKSCLPLSSKERLLLVEIGDEQVVIGVAPGFVGHIKSLEKPLVLDSSSATPSFSSVDFSTTLKKIVSGNRNNPQAIREPSSNA